MPDPTDRDLLRLAARGDAAAFSDFYRRYVRVLLAFFLRRTGDPMIAADLAAETFATGEIASRLRCSGAVVRQRVSRGLRALATELEDGR